MHRILVTGAAGLIGGLLREGLAGVYPELRLLDIQSMGQLRAGEEHVIADLRDMDAVMAAMEGVDAVVHLAIARTVIPDT